MSAQMMNAGSKKVDLKELSRDFVAAFNAKDASRCANLMTEDVVFEHPVVKRVAGKQEAIRFIKSIFGSCKKLLFVARNVFADGNTTIIEFVFTLDHKVYTGVDVVDWKDAKIHAIRRAYRDV